MKIVNKSREIQEDFDKFSQGNKHRVVNELKKIIAVRGLAVFLTMLVDRNRKRRNVL